MSDRLRFVDRKLALLFGQRGRCRCLLLVCNNMFPEWYLPGELKDVAPVSASFDSPLQADGFELAVCEQSVGIHGTLRRVGDETRTAAKATDDIAAQGRPVAIVFDSIGFHCRLSLRVFLNWRRRLLDLWRKPLGERVFAGARRGCEDDRVMLGHVLALTVDEASFPLTAAQCPRHSNDRVQGVIVARSAKRGQTARHAKVLTWCEVQVA